MNIPAYYTEKSLVNGFRFYHYLHIRGGSGNKYDRQEKFLSGGEYDFIIFYASPEQMEGCNICERVWCVQNNILYGIGKTIEEAYESYIFRLRVTNLDLLERNFAL